MQAHDVAVELVPEPFDDDHWDVVCKCGRKPWLSKTAAEQWAERHARWAAA